MRGWYRGFQTLSMSARNAAVLALGTLEEHAEVHDAMTTLEMPQPARPRPRHKDKNDLNPRLAGSRHVAKLSRLLLGCIDAEFLQANIMQS